MIRTTTKGAVVDGAPFILGDGSLLEIPDIDVRVDGQRIESVGVTPVVPVDYILDSQSDDPQLEAAINKTVEIMG
jgi:carboxyl-terminal processing protease